MTDDEFKANWSQCVSHLRGCAMKLTRNHDDAEDLLQETGYRAIQYSERAYVGNFYSWCYRIMRSIYISGYRAGQRSPKVVSLDAPVGNDSTDRPLTLGDRVGDERMRPEEIASLPSLIAALNECLEALPDPPQGDIYLRFSGGMTLEAIARQRGVSRHAIEGRIARGLKKMRKCLEKEGMDLEGWMR